MILTVAAIIGYTLVACLNKFLASRVRAGHVVAVATLSVALCALGMLVGRGDWRWSWGCIGLAAASGLAFYWASVLQMRAMRDTSTALVIGLGSLNLVIAGAVMLLLPWFGGSISFSRVVALAVAGAALMVSVHLQHQDRIAPQVFVALGLLVFCSISYTVAAHWYTAPLLYIVVNHAVGPLMNAKRLKAATAIEWRWGALLGVLMFGSFWALLEALAQAGPTGSPLVLLALNIRTPLTALLTALMFQETLCRRKVAALGLALGAMMLWIG